MKQSESEILSILDAHKDAPMVNPNKVYPPLPPLVRIPKEMCFTKKIGGTEYIVNAHFREGGRDLLSMLMGILERSISGLSYRQEDGEDEE